MTTRLPSGLKAAETTELVMAFEGCDFAPGLGVPEPRGVVTGGGDDARAVRAEGGRDERTVMAFEGRDFAPGLGVPESRGVVLGGGDDALAVRAEGCRINMVPDGL